MTEHITSGDADLQFTNDIRKKLVTSMIVNDEMPKETRDKMVLLAALDGIDRAAIGVKRIEAEREIGGKQSQASAILAELFKDGRTLQVGVAIGGRTEIPMLSDDIQPTRILEGELSTLISSDSFDAFSERNQLSV